MIFLMYKARDFQFISPTSKIKMLYFLYSNLDLSHTVVMPFILSSSSRPPTTMKSQTNLLNPQHQGEMLETSLIDKLESPKSFIFQTSAYLEIKHAIGGILMTQ